MKKNVFDIYFDPIKVQIHKAHQNDRLNFSFVEDIYIGSSQKMARNGCKTDFFQLQI